MTTDSNRWNVKLRKIWIAVNATDRLRDHKMKTMLTMNNDIRYKKR